MQAWAPQMQCNSSCNLRDVIDHWYEHLGCCFAGVADVLASGPKTPQEIADVLGIYGSSDAIFRLLRFSVSGGIFAADRPLKGSETCFRNNKMSILLRSDHPNSIRAMVMHLGGLIELF